MVARKLDLFAVSEVGMLARVLIGAMVVLGFGTNVCWLHLQYAGWGL